MTERNSFKRLVRARMEKTGESYMAARAALLAGGDGGDSGPAAPVMQVSDEAVRRRTGRGWEEWFDLLDDAGAAEMEHRDIARWLAEKQGVAGWWAQSVTVGYERARQGRAVGQRAQGFSVTASKTVAVPVERLFDAVADPAERERWLPSAEMGERTATKPKGARYDWGGDGSRVIFGFSERGEGKSNVALEHERLRDADEAERMKAFWRERVAALKEELER